MPPLQGIVMYPKTDEYDYVPSHVKVMTSGRTHENRVAVAAAADLANMAQHLTESELAELAERFPAVSKDWLHEVHDHGHPHTRKPNGTVPQLPHIASAEPSPRVLHAAAQAAARAAAPVAPPPRGRGKKKRGGTGPSPRGAMHARVGGRTRSQVSDGRDERTRRLQEALEPGSQPLDGGDSGIGRSQTYVMPDDNLWEENPAILAPTSLLRMQPIELLFQRREQALDGLRGLLHSLSRVRGAAHQLPAYVAKSYRFRLQHAIGWYRVTTTELVERIAHERRGSKPTCRRTPKGELRSCYEPYMLGGANILLVIGRVDLAFAPLPMAADPVLLLWFSSSAHEWVGEGTVPERLLQPSKMHTLLELSRMQRAHEILLIEAEVYGLSPLPLPYEPRDNGLGVTFELLLYGSTTSYYSTSRRFRAALHLMYQRMEAARVIGKMLRGWIVRSQLAMYKAAIKLQAVYRRWKAVTKRRAERRAKAAQAADEAKLAPFPPENSDSFSKANALGKWDGPTSRILARGRRFKNKEEAVKGASSGFMKLLGKNKSANATPAASPTKMSVSVPSSFAEAFPAAKTSRALALFGIADAAQAPLDDDDEGEGELDADEARIRDSATRIQARMRGVNAQKMVFNLAEVAWDKHQGLRNPRGAAAVASVCKAYRARNAFSMLLLKAFKQRQMAIVMSGGEGGAESRRIQSEEQSWRMAVESVRERCMQGLMAAEQELQSKVKAHEDFVGLQYQFERATARVQFWEALKANSLPPHLLTLTAFDESTAIERASEYLDQLIGQRALLLPEGMEPKLHVSKLVGAVKALQELTDAMGQEMHELLPLERQLRSHLAHMGVLDPASQEAPPPVSHTVGRAMLPTQASQHRTRMNALMLAGMQPNARRRPSGERDQSPGGSPEKSASQKRLARQPSVASVDSIDSPAARAAAAQERVAAEKAAAEKEAAERNKAKGEALEEAIVAARSELNKLEAVREVLVELKAVDTPPRFAARSAREAELRCDALADGMRHLTERESLHEHLSHFCAQARGTLDLLECADAFDYRRQRRRLRGEFATLGIQSMQLLRAETGVKKQRDRMKVIEAMQHYLENELPALEKRAKERVEAVASLHVALPVDIIDDRVQQAIIDDVEDWLGLASLRFASSGRPGQGHQRIRVHAVAMAASPADSAVVSINVMEGAGPSVDDLLAQLAQSVARDPNEWECCNKLLSSERQYTMRLGSARRQLVLDDSDDSDDDDDSDIGKPRFEVIGVTTAAAHTIVHDSRTLADRKRELEESLEAVKAELRPLQAKELMASAAQTQLYKLDGVEDCLAQCQSTRLLAKKEEQRAQKPKLLQLAHDSESHITRYAEEQRNALELEARIEALTRLIACAQADAAADAAGADASSNAYPTSRNSKEYSTTAFREVSQQIMRERRQQDYAIRTQQEEETAPSESSDSLQRRKFHCQGSLQLLKDLHQEDLEINKSQPPPEAPSVRLVAHSRFLRRADTAQRDAIKMMAREAAAIRANSGHCAQSSTSSGGHWAQMKAMIQMTPRRSLVDETVFDESDVERAASEIEVDLRGVSTITGTKASGLSCLPLVLYFMRAPLPYPFEEELPKAPARAEKKPPTPRKGGGGGGGSFRSSDGSSGVGQPSASPSRVSREFSLAEAPPLGRQDKVPRAINSRAGLIYRNSLNNEVDGAHPLRHVYARLARRAERTGMKRATPDTTSPEAWMEFVDQSGTPYYYCFLTRQKDWDFPRLMPIGQLGLAVKTSMSTHAMRLKKRLLQQPKRRLSAGSLEAMRMNMEAEQRSKERRAAMLKKMPLPVSHIVFTAQYLGIDTLTQTHLMWLASAALCDTLSPTLPVGWEIRKLRKELPAAKDQINKKPPVLPHYYYNTTLRVSQWEHPALTHWRSVLAELQQFERQQLGEAAARHDRLVEHFRFGGVDRPRPTIWLTDDPGATAEGR